MHYLIDGHNLIPKLPGLSLVVIDDELRLVELLQEYCRRSRNKVEVYFDNAPLEQAGTRKVRHCECTFLSLRDVPPTMPSALRLGNLGRAGRGWIVVSSDHRVQAEARAVHAQAVPSEKFSRELLAVLGSSAEAEKPSDAALNPEEVAAWMGIFAGHSHKPKQGR